MDGGAFGVPPMVDEQPLEVPAIDTSLLWDNIQSDNKQPVSNDDDDAAGGLIVSNHSRDVVLDADSHYSIAVPFACPVRH